MTFKSKQVTALALLCALVAVNPAHATIKAAGQGKPVATVNNVAIPQARLDLNIKAITQQGQPDSPELRKKVTDELIDLEVVAQEARKKGLDKQSEVVQIMEVTRQNILSNAFAQDFFKNHPISEIMIKQEYEKQTKNMAGSKEYKVAHILVESEKEAQAIAALLKNNGDFGKLANEKSKDSGSKAHGGDLGWISPAAFVPPLSEVMIKLNKGQISAPIQTQFGWHILKLEDVRDFEVPPYDKVKGDLGKRMQQMALQEAVMALRKNAKIN